MLLKRSFHLLVFFCVVVGSGVVAAQTTVIETPLATLGRHVVTTSDLQVDLLRLPEQGRNVAAADSGLVRQAAANLVMRKALAAEAVMAGFDKNPLVQQQLSLLTDRILSDAWLAEVDKKSQLPEAEIERLAELKYKSEAFSRFKQTGQIKVRHILFEKTDEGKALAVETLGKLKSGADFAELAKLHSKDPGSAARGGDLGLVGPGRMVPPFEQAAYALKNSGDLSDLVESGFGWHIIRLDERQADTIVSFADVKAGLMQEVDAKVRTDARNGAAANLFKQVRVSDDAVQKFVESTKPVQK